ncbi:hypothetical protein Vdis_0611 [Vulcanisaeta distributa DSM 14429]|uniref:Uncharacterized protein n=2 Tax=Vulcanisaeta distributa TaxID=164451 RepID=E1QV80_VULDI|nr:hypothetical protein Vdis_0611 [Vulcanisaeta distributa DSM 14429]
MLKKVFYMLLIMPNLYLYAVVALVVILVVVGAYLGMMVGNEASKISTLQGEVKCIEDELYGIEDTI